MGLFKALALLPLAPAQGVVWVARQIQTEVDRQQLGPEAIMQQLAALQEELDQGRLTEEEYLVAEDELLDLLEAREEPE